VNTARLVFGWLFLAGFTAFGTYYAMDEAVHRIGLARFQLHEKLGIVRYASAVQPIRNQTPPINNQTPPINNNQQPPIQTNPQPINNNPQPPIQTNPQPPIQTNPQPINNNPQPIQTSPQPPIQTNPQPPINNNPQPPISRNPQPPVNIQTPPVNQGPQQRPRPADFTETQIRLDRLKGQASHFKSTISRMQGPYGTGRLDEPMSNLNRFLRQAEAALNNNDTATAKRYMDQADTEVGKLKELLDQ